MKFNDRVRVNFNGNILTINVYKDISSSEFRLYLLSTFGFDIYKDSIILPNVITKYSSFVFSSVSSSINIAYMLINGTKEELVIKDSDSSLKIDLYPDKHFKINYSYVDGNYYYSRLYDSFKPDKSFLVSGLKLSKLYLDLLDEDKALARLINIESFYTNIHIQRGNDFESVISDDKISLLVPKDNDYKYGCKCLIMLNSTLQIVGSISLDLSILDFNFYNGNVAYRIDPEFRHRHYATRALNLLRKLVLEYKIDTDLIISTDYANTSSQAVCTNNGARLIYDGKLPHNNPIRSNKVDRVKVYNLPLSK